jgi:hypothetical protein
MNAGGLRQGALRQARRHARRPEVLTVSERAPHGWSKPFVRLWKPDNGAGFVDLVVFYWVCRLFHGPFLWRP